MAPKRKGLSRGLDALLGGLSEADAIKTTETTHEEVRDGKLRNLPVEFLQRGKYQPRRDMSPEALEELANSIRSQGVMQPIVVRPVGDNRFEIIAGERRWRATQQAGLDTIPAIIRDVPDEAAIAMALIENIQREDLNPIEEAQALLRLQKEFELTQAEVAEAVGKSRTTVTNLLRLNNLESEVRRMVEHGDLEMGHAKALLGLQGNDQSTVARVVVGKGMTVRQTEDLVRKTIADKDKPKAAPAKKDSDIYHLEEQLSEKIGCPVTIQHSAKGKGKLTLSYNSLDELDGILAHLK